jgi:hypothetical protein
MNVAGWIVLGLAIALVGALSFGGMALKAEAERKRYEREKEKIKQQGAENAQHMADAISEADKIKENANTGNHADDMHTMAEQLHQYANSGK